MIRTTTILLLSLLLGVPAFAGPEPEKPAKDAAADEEAKKKAELEEARARQAKISIDIFRKEFKSRETGRRMMAILTLAQVQHDSVIDELGKKPLFDPDPEVRDAVAQAFAEFTWNPELAGGYLKKALPKNEDEPEVMRSIIRSIGKIGYKGAFEELKEAASRLNEEKYQWVTVEVVRTFGTLEDPRCLPFLLWMSEYGGRALKWATGSVTVDTGAAGDVDQRAAEAAWKAKYGHIKPKKPPAPIIRTYMDELRKTVKQLTGKEFETSTEFRKWLEENAEKLGLDPKNLDKD